MNRYAGGWGNLANAGNTTSAGGSAGNGTVFELVAPSGGKGRWVEKVLYSFGTGNDGATPVAGVTFDAAGTGWQTGAHADGSDCEYPSDGFTTGRVAGIAVPCLSPRVQWAHHLGYEPRPRDRDDMRRLAQAFDLALPAPYS